jgi:hypothetical protein
MKNLAARYETSELWPGRDAQCNLQGYAAYTALRSIYAIYAQASCKKRISGAEPRPNIITPARGDIFPEIRTRVADIYDATAIVLDLKMRTQYNARSRLNISRDFAAFFGEDLWDQFYNTLPVLASAGGGRSCLKT